MQIFQFLFDRMLPLYSIIVLGYIAGKKLEIKKQYIAKLLIYIIAPVIVFNGVATVSLTPETLLLPFIFFVLASFISYISLYIGRRLWKDSTANLLSFVGGAGNTGYFGIPLALVLFTPEQVSRVILSVLGIILFENSVGFYILSRGSTTVRQSVHKILKLPALYAFGFGIIFSLMHVVLPLQWTDSIKLFSGTYTVLGMMIVGMGIAEITTFSFDWLFVGASLLLRYAIWPIIMVIFIRLDAAFFHIFPQMTYSVLLLMASVPVAANTVTYATELNTQPEKASLVVLISTICALVYIPFVTLTLF